MMSARALLESKIIRIVRKRQKNRFDIGEATRGKDLTEP